MRIQKQEGCDCQTERSSQDSRGKGKYEATVMQKRVVKVEIIVAHNKPSTEPRWMPGGGLGSLLCSDFLGGL